MRGGEGSRGVEGGVDCSLDRDRNDQGTTTILLDAGFLVSEKCHGQNMFDFFILAHVPLYYIQRYVISGQK